MPDDLLSGTGPDDYNASSIEVLEGLEPVRKRPGMYIGGTDERALHHLVAEVLDNSMDEAVAGHATRIEVELLADYSVMIRDNGRGIPVDPHPKFPGKSALEVILCTLHSGGKFGGKAYQTSGGLHGVGASVVNALSDSLVVQVARNKELYEQRFSRGIPLGPMRKGSPSVAAALLECFPTLMEIPTPNFIEYVGESGRPFQLVVRVAHEAASETAASVAESVFAVPSQSPRSAPLAFYRRQSSMCQPAVLDSRPHS